MSWRQLLFGFRGRINRKPYWIGIIALTVFWIGIIALTVFILAVAFAAGVLTVSLELDAQDPFYQLGFASAVLIMVLTAYPGVALSVKRLHDRNKSAWWLLVFYVLPGVLDGLKNGLDDESAKLALSILSAGLGIWALVELGIRRGTQGPNRYGLDPLGARAADAAM